MTNSLAFDLQELGYLARRSELSRRGHTPASIDLALKREVLLRPIRGWVATRDARQDAVVAVVNRGSLTGSSALRALGVWSGTSADIHVRIPPNMPSTRALQLTPISAFAPAHSTGRLVRHWAMTRFESGRSWRTSVVDALIAFSRLESAEYAVASIENALHTRCLPPRDLPALLEFLPSRLSPYVALIDGRAESGTESLARLRLTPLATRLDIQVRVGPHRLDILIDGWLNVEIDSEQWHGKERLANSRRDTWLTARGYVVLRFDYHEVMHEWEACAAAVIATLRDPRRRTVR